MAILLGISGYLRLLFQSLQFLLKVITLLPHVQRHRVGWPARQQIGQLFLKFSHAFTSCFAGRRFFPGDDSLYPVLKDTSR